MTTQKPLTILRLSAENIKRLSVVEITPDGSPVIVIGGENESGKSSVLDAIAYALGGKDLLPTQPIRKGQPRAAVTVDLGDYIVTRTFTATGGSLVVTNRDGLKYPSPQALLDGLVGKLTFDPLAFADMDEKIQTDTLRRLAGIDTSDLDEARKKAFDERTLLNRDVTQTQGAVAKMATYPDVGLVTESFDALTQELATANELAQFASDASAQEIAASTAVTTATRKAAAAESRVDTLRNQLAAAEAEHEAAAWDVTVATDHYHATTQASKEAAVAVPDRAALLARIGQIEARNHKVFANQQRTSLGIQLAAKKAKAEDATGTINRLDAEKAERLAAATFPIAGLGLADDGSLTWQGLPFAQASTAVKVRVSVAIGFALNPRLKVLLVRNGNDLGRKNLRLIAELAKGTPGAQVWIERIAGGDGLPTVMIEDGTVAEMVNA